MSEYKIYLGKEHGHFWGTLVAKNDEDAVSMVKEQIEALHPLNSSDEGAENYRNRFRGQPIWSLTYTNEGKKVFKLLI